MPSKKKEFKVKYELTIKKIECIPKKAGGHNIHVEWKRGKKKENRGQTPSILLPEGKTSIEINHKLEMTCTLVCLDLKNQKFQEKNIHFTVVGEKIKDNKSDAIIGKLILDLSKFVFPGTFNSEQTFELIRKKDKDDKKNKNKETKKKSEPTLTLSIRSQWASIGGRSVVQGTKSQSETKDKEKKSKKSKEETKKDEKDTFKKEKDPTKSKSSTSLRHNTEDDFKLAEELEKSKVFKRKSSGVNRLNGGGQDDGHEESSQSNDDEDNKSTFEIAGQLYHLGQSLDDKEQSETEMDQPSEVDQTEDYLSESDEDESMKERKEIKNNTNEEKKNTTSGTTESKISTQTPSSSSLSLSPINPTTTTPTIDKTQSRGSTSTQGSLLDKKETTSHEPNASQSSSLSNASVSMNLNSTEATNSEFKQLQAKLEEAEKSPLGTRNISQLLATAPDMSKSSINNETNNNDDDKKEKEKEQEKRKEKEKEQEKRKEKEKEQEKQEEKEKEKEKHTEKEKEKQQQKKTEQSSKDVPQNNDNETKNKDNNSTSIDESQSQTGDDDFSTQSESKKERKKREKQEKKALKKLEKEKKQKEKEEKKEKERSRPSTESFEKKPSKFSLFKKDKKKKAELQEEIEKLTNEFSRKEQNYKDEISKLQSELESLKEQLQQEKQKNQNNQREAQFSSKSNKEKKKEKDQIISTLKEENRILSAKIEPLEKENKSLKSELENLKQQLKQTQNSATKTHSQGPVITTLNTLTSNDDRKKDQELNSLRSEVEELREVNESQSATIQQLENELKKYRNKDKAPSSEERVMQNIANLSKGQEIEAIRTKLNIIQTQLDFMRRLEEFIYGVQFKYDTNGRNICALELSKFLQTHNFLTNENVNKTKTVMESDEDLNKREFLQNLLKAIIRSYRRDVDDVNRLSGWLMWIVTLYKSLTTHNKSKYLDLDNSGLSIPFETTTQALSILHEKKDSSDNETSIMPEKLLHSLYTKLHIKEDNFLAQLEILLAHLFILIILRIRETLESLKFLEIIFDQRQVTRTNDKNSSLAADAFEPKVVAVGEQPVLRLVRLLTLHYRALEEHHTLKSINKQVFSQVFYFMSSSALNKMLTSSEFCRALRAYAMKMAFSHLEIWATRRDLVVPLREHFEIILQACSLLMLDKNVCSNEDVLSNVFSKLNAKQIKQLLNSFQPDELAPNPVPMSARMTVDKLASNVTAELLCDINRIVVVTKLNQ